MGKVAELRSQARQFGGDARMDDLCHSRVAGLRFGDRLGMRTTTAPGCDQERLHFGCLRAAIVQADICTQKTRQLEQVLQRCR